MPEHLTSALFNEHLNTKFRFQTGGPAPLEVELIEVTEGKPHPRTEKFALLFRGPLETFIEQKLYRVEHDKMEPFELFIVPVGREEDGFFYEAVFNRLLPRVK